MLTPVVVATVLGVAFLALGLFARDSHPYESHLYEVLREWLAPRRPMLFLIGVVLFVPLVLFVAYLRLGS